MEQLVKSDVSPIYGLVLFTAREFHRTSKEWLTKRSFGVKLNNVWLN